MVITTNNYCPDCGRQMLLHPLGYCCQDCGQIYSLTHLASIDPIEIHHGEPCDACDGTGEEEVERVQYHPYGETSAAEHYVDIEDCPDCAGLGYHDDFTETLCVACGLEVGWLEDAVVDGWHVHAHCADERLPKLETF